MVLLTSGWAVTTLPRPGETLRVQSNFRATFNTIDCVETASRKYTNKYIPRTRPLRTERCPITKYVYYSTGTRVQRKERWHVGAAEYNPRMIGSTYPTLQRP